MGLLITCSGCKHILTLPEGFIGQQVRCPKCDLEFAAYPSAAPPMEVDPPAPPVEPKPAEAKPAASPPLKEATPPLHTAYTQRDRVSAPASRPSFYCILCGAGVGPDEDSCPNCGCPIQSPPEEDYFRSRRRPRARELSPIRWFLAILPAIMIPMGVTFFFGAAIASDVIRRGPGSFIIPGFLVIVGIGLEVAALVCCILWLYQAWRIVLQEDEEYSPGLMVGLLFVPFFNFYWMFRAIPGLSRAIHREMRYLAPTRAFGAGWIPGVLACIFFLIPYGQPVAVCVFLAWMLIANNALHRLVRMNERLLADEERDVDERASGDAPVSRN